MSRSDITTKTTEVSVWMLGVVSVVLCCSLLFVLSVLSVLFLLFLLRLLFPLFVLSVLSSKNYFGRTVGFKIKKAAGRLVFCCLSAHDVRMCPPVTSVFNRRMMCIENLTCRGSRQKQ